MVAATPPEDIEITNNHAILEKATKFGIQTIKSHDLLKIVDRPEGSGIIGRI